jgi:DNA-binding transcriptional MerR regulator
VKRSDYTLAELAEQAGVPARTVRYYIARGLLDGPQKAGRAASYGEEHVERLRKIQRLQSEGRTLVEIARDLDGGKRARPALGEPSGWWQYPLAADVTVMIKAESSPWRLKQVRAALEQFAARIQDEQTEEQE